jgi:hypothetical protein
MTAHGLKIDQFSCQIRYGNRFSFAQVGELVVLAENAFERAIGEKNGP